MVRLVQKNAADDKGNGGGKDHGKAQAGGQGQGHRGLWVFPEGWLDCGNLRKWDGKSFAGSFTLTAFMRFEVA